jgi:hypothetical protein
MATRKYAALASVAILAFATLVVLVPRVEAETTDDQKQAGQLAALS